MANLPNNSNIPDFVLDNNTLSKVVKSNPKDKIDIEIGDSKQPDFKPQAKISRWSNECNFSIRAEEHPAATTEVVDGKVKYKTPNYEVHLYEKPEVSEDGGFEFEWSLPKKPQSNVLTATIQTKELDFFYQPALTHEEIDEGASRPENVVGSYAVYHKTKKNNKVGGNEYKTGKAFHIYRPKAIDDNGVETWCELNIDEQAGTLTVTVPQDFLNKAIYPVVVDPTFGYTSAGATINSTGGTGASGPETTTEDGNVTSISIYGRSYSGTPSASVGIYTDDSDAPDALVASATDGTIASTDSWNTSNISASVTGSTDYWLAFGASVILYYSDSVSGYSRTNGTAGFPDPYFENSRTTSRRVSIYATYTASGGSSSPSSSPSSSVSSSPSSSPSSSVSSSPSSSVSSSPSSSVSSSVSSSTSSSPSSSISSSPSSSVSSSPSSSPSSSVSSSPSSSPSGSSSPSSSPSSSVSSSISSSHSSSISSSPSSSPSSSVSSSPSSSVSSSVSSSPSSSVSSSPSSSISSSISSSPSAAPGTYLYPLKRYNTTLGVWERVR